MTLDPALQLTALVALALVFASAAWHKLADMLAFELALDAYALLPAWLLRPFAWTLPLLELVTVALLLAAPVRLAGSLLALGLLGLVTGAVVINLVRGRTDVGCGCGGIEDEQTLSWALVARNALLALLGLAGLVPAGSRTLVWLDYLSVAAGALALFLLVVLANQLVANRPRLARLRVRVA
ncbi:MAG: MauE/DoxX family redox-associated membrane protein [Gammaproteobacteria bacterium]